MLDRDDRVGVHVRFGHRRGDASPLGERLHDQSQRRRASVTTPVMAAAAATAGLARWVRARGPCRPSKLRFEVETHRAPGGTTSSFTAAHIEHPGSRHSKPASRKTRCKPSASASRLTVIEPGTTKALTWLATL